MPFLPLEHPEALAAIGELLPEGTFLLTGALRRERASGRRDSRTGARDISRLQQPDGFRRCGGACRRLRQDPSGSVRRVFAVSGDARSDGLRAADADARRVHGGAGPAPAAHSWRPSLRPAGLICYEAIFPGEVVAQGARPGLLINVTNDGWFGNTTGPRQHFHQARVRAVEEGLPLIRAANNGISAVVDADGGCSHRLGLNERGVIDSGVPTASAADTLCSLRRLDICVQYISFLLRLIIVLSRRQQA